MIDIKIYPSSTYAVLSEKLTYTMIVKNEYDFIVEDIVLKSTLDEQIRFIIGSVSVDNKILKDESIISGINIGNLEPKSSKVIKLDVETICKKDKSINIKVITEYKYASESNSRKYWESISCEVKPVKIYNPQINIEVSSDTREVQLGDIITFNINLYNNGDIDLFNLYMVDIIPKSLQVIDGSFKVNSKVINSVDISKGVILGDLATGISTSIEYRAKVLSALYGNKIENRLKIGYYISLDNGAMSYKESNECGVKISLDMSNFKQFNIDNYIKIGEHRPKLSEVNDIKAEIIVDRYSVIKTSQGISKEGFRLSGYKLIIHGRILEVLEYEAFESISSIHSSQYETPFSTYIVLPQDFIVGTNIDVGANIEHISHMKISDDTFYRSIDINIFARIKCK